MLTGNKTGPGVRGDNIPRWESIISTYLRPSKTEYPTLNGYEFSGKYSAHLGSKGRPLQARFDEGPQLGTLSKRHREPDSTVLDPPPVPLSLSIIQGATKERSAIHRYCTSKVCLLPPDSAVAEGRGGRLGVSTFALACPHLPFCFNVPALAPLCSLMDLDPGPSPITFNSRVVCA